MLAAARNDCVGVSEERLQLQQENTQRRKEMDELRKACMQIQRNAKQEVSIDEIGSQSMLKQHTNKTILDVNGMGKGSNIKLRSGSSHINWKKKSYLKQNESAVTEVFHKGATILILALGLIHFQYTCIEVANKVANNMNRIFIYFLLESFVSWLFLFIYFLSYSPSFF